MIRFATKEGQTPWLSSGKPVRKELERLDIETLYFICKRKKRIKYPFKKALIDYLMQLDEL